MGRGKVKNKDFKGTVILANVKATPKDKNIFECFYQFGKPAEKKKEREYEIIKKRYCVRISLHGSGGECKLFQLCEGSTT